MKLRIKLSMFKDAIYVAKCPTYYPEFIRKNFIVRVCENIRWVLKYKESNRFYNLYGLDIKKNRQIFHSNYCDYDLNFRLIRDEKNKVNNPNSQIYLLRDKFQFWKYLKSYGISTPNVFAIIINGKIFDTNFEEKSFEWICKHNDFFVKDNNGECGSFVRHIRDGKDFYTIKHNLQSGTFICQERVEQACCLSKIYPNSVNTVRIVSVRKGNSISILSSILRVGTSKSKNIDNWARGGLVIGLSDGGKLSKYGFYKPYIGKKVTTHPDTGVEFADIQLPCFEMVKSLVSKAHQLLYGIHSIGWDVCISDDGPIIIEGNDNWELSLMQAANGGLKKEWLSF